MDLKFLCICLAGCPVFRTVARVEKARERRKLGARGAREQMRDAQVVGATKLIQSSFLIDLRKHTSPFLGLRTLFVSIRILFHFESFEAFLQ